MKLERRGKYPGVKVHVDPPDWAELMAGDLTVSALKWAKKLIKLVKEEEKAHPNLWKARTAAEVEAELVKEKTKAESKLAKLKAGSTWNEKADLVRCTKCQQVSPTSVCEPIEDPILLAAGLVAYCCGVPYESLCDGLCRVEETSDGVDSDK